MRILIPWQTILLEALNEATVIAVVQVVQRHLGRAPTRSEITSARRAANTLADAGKAQRVYVTSGNETHAGRALLHLARPDAADLFLPDKLWPAVASPPARLPRRGRPRSEFQLARGLARTMSGVAAAARLIDVQRLEPDHAVEIATQLTQSLQDVVQLRHLLLQRRHHRS